MWQTNKGDLMVAHFIRLLQVLIAEMIKDFIFINIGPTLRQVEFDSHSDQQFSLRFNSQPIMLRTHCAM